MVGYDINFKSRITSAFFLQQSLKIIILGLVFFQSLPALSQTKTYKNELGFNSENDSFLATGQDRYYTNGLFISFRSALNQKSRYDSAFVAANPNKNLSVKKIWSLSIGQQLFNAQTGAVPDVTFVDRPFAAYLFVAGSLQFLDSEENSGKLTLQVGTIGPSALGEETQNFIHDTFGFYDINGWQYQVKDEIGVNTILNLHYLLKKSKDKKYEFSVPVEARLGNTYSGLKTGILFRAGLLNPLYHSVATNSNVSTYKEANVNQKEFYFFAKPSLDLIVYDATFKGGLFREDKGPVTFKPNLLVFSQEVGVAYTKNRWTADFSLIFKSKESKAMVNAHQYGSVNLYYRF